MTDVIDVIVDVSSKCGLKCEFNDAWSIYYESYLRTRQLFNTHTTECLDDFIPTNPIGVCDDPWHNRHVMYAACSRRDWPEMLELLKMWSL